ncbi:MAG: DNA/RNA nuclease SfsA [Thermoproteota archaeon]
MVRGEIVEGIFRRRLTRFSALVKVNGRVAEVFLPNPGRMVEVLNPGSRVLLKEVASPERKTDYDLIGVRYKGSKISLDSRVPNKLVKVALKNKGFPEFSGYDVIKPEYQYGHSRFDFFLNNGGNPCLVEVKSCTKVRRGVALFSGC